MIQGDKCLRMNRDRNIFKFSFGNFFRRNNDDNKRIKEFFIQIFGIEYGVGG